MCARACVSVRLFSMREMKFVLWRFFIFIHDDHDDDDEKENGNSLLVTGSQNNLDLKLYLGT